MSTLTGIISALGSTATWALSAVLFKKLGNKLDPIGMTTVKALLSALFLFLFVIFSGINPFIDLHVFLSLILSGIIGISIGDSCFFASLGRLSPLVLSILLFIGPDFFSGVLGLVFLGEMPIIQVWLGIILILCGIGFLIFPTQNREKLHKTTVIGIIYALISLFCTSISMVIIKPVLAEISTITATMYRMLFGGMLLFIYGLSSKKINTWKQPFLNGDYKWGFIGTVLLVTFGGFWLSLLAIKNCELIVASTIMSLEILFVLLFMIIFSKYKAKINEYLGILLSIVGIIFILIFSF